MLRIATATAFPQDRVAAHIRLLESVEVDAVLLAYLGDDVLSQAAVQRTRDARAGFVEEVTAGIGAVAPRLFLNPELKIVTDAGGVNPLACAQSVAGVLEDAGSGEVLLGAVRGDDLLDSLEELRTSGCALENVRTGESFGGLQQPILAAHAEIGGRGVSHAISQGARVVIGGTIAAASLVAGTAMSAFGWGDEDWDRLAGAAVAGALLSSGTRLTADLSGIDRSDPGSPSPPIAELSSQGQVAISKVPATEGAVTRAAVAASVASSANGPSRLLTPDVDVDLASVHISQRRDRQDVLVGGVSGRPPAASCKTTLWYQDGFTARAHVWLCGTGSVRRAAQTAEAVFDRVRQAGGELEHADWQLPGLFGDPAALPDAPVVLLRLTAADRRREVVDLFLGEVTALEASSSGCVMPLADGRPTVKPLVRRWPTEVPREFIAPAVEVRPAREWL